MNDIIGIDGAGPIWHDFMAYALRDTPPEPFPVPPNITVQCVPGNMGMPPDAGQKCWHEVFVKGTEKGAVGQYIPIGGRYTGSSSAPASASPSASPSGSPAPSPAPSAAPPPPPSPAPAPAPAKEPPGHKKKD
jgi:membrane carboxypeptidase/penicillin-binding protein